jgi:hypothetical protein
VKRAQQEHTFFTDGVADLLIVEQEIDKLRDLNVFDGNLGFVHRCDYQVLLLGIG